MRFAALSSTPGERISDAGARDTSPNGLVCYHLSPPTLIPTGCPMSTPPRLELAGSRNFTCWLAEPRARAAPSPTYQCGKVFFICLQPDEGLSLFERTFNRCIGMWTDGQTIYMSSLFEVWRFENSLLPDQSYEGYDRLYVPRVGYTTGHVDGHDIGVDRDGKAVFVSTLFSCLARVSERYSFGPSEATLYQPAGRGGSLPSEWPGHGGRGAALSHQHLPQRCQRGLA